MGSYLGQMDPATDAAYEQSTRDAVGAGINFIDTSLNYRHQSSERNIGQALAALFDSGQTRREEIVVCTKAGFLVPNAIPSGTMASGDTVARMHSMAPAFLADQLERSRDNLRLQTVDVFYLHNPETQLGHVARDVFDHRVGAAFETLEKLASAGNIRFYGTATWSGYRDQPPEQGLSLVRLESLARDVAGASHRFRFIQLPFNLAMPEAAAARREVIDGRNLTILEAATELGITVVASASLLQARLSRDLPESVAERLPGATTDAQRAIQFTRSAAGLAVALVGMSSPAHVAENAAIASIRPADLSAWFPPNR